MTKRTRQVPGQSLVTAILAIFLALSTTVAWAQPRTSTAQANVMVLAQKLVMPGLDRERTIRLYLPPGYADTTRRYPVLYMHDAQNLFDDATSFVGEWGVDETLNELARTRRFEIIVVGIDHGGATRNTELIPWDSPQVGKAEGRAYMEFLVNVVKPYIDRHYRTRPERESTAIMGSSVGALISHYALLTYPQVFAGAGILSPAYWISDQAYVLAAANPLPRDARIYFSAGAKEPGKTVENLQRMVTVVREKAARPENILVEVMENAQHNEANWRVAFPKAIAWLFATPGAETAPKQQSSEHAAEAGN